MVVDAAEREEVRTYDSSVQEKSAEILEAMGSFGTGGRVARATLTLSMDWNRPFPEVEAELLDTLHADAANKVIEEIRAVEAILDETTVSTERFNDLFSAYFKVREIENLQVAATARHRERVS